MGILEEISAAEKGAVGKMKKKMDLNGTGGAIDDDRILAVLGFKVLTSDNGFSLVGKSGSGLKPGNETIGSTKYSFIKNAGMTAALLMAALCLFGYFMLMALSLSAHPLVKVYGPAFPVLILVFVVIAGLGMILTLVFKKYRCLEVFPNDSKMQIRNENGVFEVDIKKAKALVEIFPMLMGLADCYDYYIVSGDARHKFNERGDYGHLRGKNKEFISNELGRILKIPIEVVEKA
ncbi:MAG: hypothetical protein WC717_04105 [Candidatus Micrarchaeia archaeon]|jgi:hypothetical protein